MSTFSSLDDAFMSRAVELARRGQGYVEPNPMVGCLVVEEGRVLAEGWHKTFGGHHAEIEALRQLPGRNLHACTMYVTLEPCCHQGKTPPCINDILMARPARVVIGMEDPFERVAGRGVALLREAGIAVEVGCQEQAVRQVNAPYLHRLATGRPWVLAKWAMTFDGKMATASGESRWISGEASRAMVHRLRGRMDGIAVGRKTIEADDPRLTARPAGSRTAARVVYATRANLPIHSELVKTAHATPTIVLCDDTTEWERTKSLSEAGCQIVRVQQLRTPQGVEQSLVLLGEMGMTNLLVEGGSELLGSFFDRRLVNEVHVFIAPLVFGGKSAPSPVGGDGIREVSRGIRLAAWEQEHIGEDLYIHGVIPARKS